MRAWTTALLILLATAATAEAVTIVNRDAERRRVMVCDQNCGPRFGDSWGSAFDFWLAPGESRTFSCAGTCFVGTYDKNGRSPTLGDMADASDDEIFRGDERGSIVNGYATHRQ
jgi:hypothetical protein